jgi:hypothetical protein
MPCSRVSSDHVALGLVAAVQGSSNVRGRLAQSGGIWGRWHLVWSWFCRTAVSVGRKSRPRRSFTPEFKVEIVELCQGEDRSMVQVSRGTST